MKRNFLSLVIIFINSFYGVKAADTNEQLIPPFNFSHVAPGDSFAFVLANTGATSIQFYPKTVFDTGLYQHSYLSWPDYLVGINEGSANPVEQLNRIAWREKSNRFYNHFVEFGDVDSNNVYLQNVVDHKFSILYHTAFSHHQCSSYRTMLNKTLKDTYAVSQDSLLELNMAHHSVSIVILNGDSIVVDADPDEPFWMPKNETGNYGVFSDYLSNIQWLDSQPHYTYCDPVSKDCGIDSVTKQLLNTNVYLVRRSCLPTNQLMI